MHDFGIINIYVLSQSLYVIYISNRNHIDNYQPYLFLFSLPMAGIFSFTYSYSQSSEDVFYVDS